MIEKWLNRINNLLEMQKDLGLVFVGTNFTRTELIELRMMIETLKDLEESGRLGGEKT